MEVIAGVSSILAVIDSVTRVAKRLNEVRVSYNDVALNITLVVSQLSTIGAALEALKEWRASDRHSTGPSRQLDKDLELSLSCCAILITVIDGKLDDSGYMPGLKQKIKYLWLEDILKDYISNLEGQVRALQLLLTIFQCRTETEKRQKLGNAETRTIMEQVRAERASLAMEWTEFQDAASVLSLNPSVTLDIDSILMESPAYRRVYGDARLRPPPAVSASPVENSEEVDHPIDTPVPEEMLKPPPLPSRPTRRPVPQSRGRINVWDYYSGENKADKLGDKAIMEDPVDVFELSGATQASSAASQQDHKLEEKQDNVLQPYETAVETVDEEVGVAGVESSMNIVSEEKPLSMKNEENVPPTLPAAVNSTEPNSTFQGFMNQFNLGFLYATAVPSKIGESYGIADSGDEVSQDVARKGSNELGRYYLSHSKDVGLDFSRRNSLQEGTERPMSTHSSLYECSITPVPKDQSTRTSSPYSCISCRNLGVTDNVPEVDNLEAEVLDPVIPSPQREPGSTGSQDSATEKNLTSFEKLQQSQQSSASAGADIRNESQYQPSKDALSFPSRTSADEQHSHDEDSITNFTTPIDNLHMSEHKDVKQVETFQSVASHGLLNVKTSGTSSPHSQESKESWSSMLPPPERVAPGKPMSPASPPAFVFFPSAESRNAESERSILSADRPSSARGATSTTSSSEATEDSTILSLQQSTSNTTATSISTHTPGVNGNYTQSDLLRLQNELATAKARGENRAVQDSSQRSIEVVRRTHLAKQPLEANNTPAKSPSPRHGKARSNFLRFPSLSSSAKGVALGCFAASGDVSSVQKILKEKVNVDSRSDNFKTPLMRAAMNGQVECMKLLKEFGADEVAVDAKGRTALHIAVASNSLAAVKWLLEAYTPLKQDSLKHRPSILFRATDVVKGVRLPKNLREASDAEGSKPLHIAAELDKGGMVKTLVAAGVNIESKDNWGRTPFHRAIISKRRDSFDTLFRSGAKIAALDAKSVSSLHLAALAGQVDMIENLLANGAERWKFDADGFYPIHSAVHGGNTFAIEALATERTDFDRRSKSGETLLHLACLRKDLEVTKHLLTKLVDVNPWAAPSSIISQILSQMRIKGSSMTPLHYACCTHDFETAVLLLDHEALVNAPTPEGATALMMAVETEDTNLVNLLLQREAKVNAKIPGSLITALHLAARRGDLETVQQLCRHHADDGTRTSGPSYGSYGRSPLEECAKCPNPKKGSEVETYIRTVITNRLNNNLRANARKLQASGAESSQPCNNPPGGQISPLANPISYTPWGGAQYGNPPNQGYLAQQAQAQNLQYYHPDFDVPDEVLPAYTPGPSAPARLVNQAPVHRYS